jgi:hypothetical protein
MNIFQTMKLFISAAVRTSGFLRILCFGIPGVEHPSSAAILLMATVVNAVLSLLLLLLLMLMLFLLYLGWMYG